MISISRPSLIYGTAWKNQATTALVKQAVIQGFRAIDTANQPKHYSEKLVGDALKELQQQGFERKQIFLQTKFTPVDGHDDRIPYNPSDPLKVQVETSFNRSLEHLQTDYVDSYLLHSPYGWPNLNDADWEVWQAIVRIYESGQTKLIGISNVNSKQLEALVEKAKIKPMIVQNRCFARQGWDKTVREVCDKHNILYQGFSLLTANPEVWESAKIEEIATRLNKTSAQVIFRFAIQIGIVPLTGTTSEIHMQNDLETLNFELKSDAIEAIENI